MKAKLLFLAGAALVLLGFHAYARNLRSYYQLSTSILAMGGVEIEVKAYHTDRRTFAAAVAETRARFEELEARLSRFREDSDVSRVNRSGAEAPVPVDATTFRLLETARRVSEASAGAFDVSCLPLILLWKEAAREGHLPDAEAVTAARSRGSFRDVSLDPDRRTVRISPGMGLDLGGIAQGLFADEGVAILRRHGIRRGLVNCSGEVAAYDDRPRPEPFDVAILDPRTGRSDRAARIDRGAVSTSGSYARFVEIGGRRYSHIVDPATGWPADRTASVTVQAPTAVEADAWSTACAVLAARGEDPSRFLPDGFRLLALVSDATRPTTAPPEPAQGGSP